MAGWVLRQWRAARGRPPFRWHIDYPTFKESLYDDLRGIDGWIAGPAPIERVVLRSEGGVDDRVELVDRPDVRESQQAWYPHAVGFKAPRFLRDWLAPSGRARLTLEIHWATGQRDSVELDWANDYARKLRKRERFKSRLACPECRGSLVESPAGWDCAACRLTYPASPYSIQFLTPDMAREFDIVPTENVSSWDYDPLIKKIIADHPDRLYLDCGAGFRSIYYDNVINFEIVDYYSTDVLGVNEKLPFADHSLDGVFSVAVLEHVKDPVRCAREIVRVMKPGGQLFCAVPFLQPLHGYPHHYYNMTRQGLLNLFGDALHIDAVLIPPALHPVNVVQWVLKVYAEGLPEPVQSQFRKMRVQEFIDLKTFKEWENLYIPYINELPEAVRTEIASGHVILATKR